MVTSMGKLLRYFLLVVLGLGLASAAVSMFAEPFFTELYEKLGLDTSSWVDPMLSFLDSSAAISGLIFVFGVTIGAWGHFFATKIDRKRKQQLPDLVSKTHLRLQFGRNVTPFQVINENVWRWYSMKIVGVLPDASRQTQTTQIFVIFDAPGSALFSRVSCSDPERQLQIHDLTERSAVIIADGDLSDTTVDVIISEDPI